MSSNQDEEAIEKTEEQAPPAEVDESQPDVTDTNATTAPDDEAPVEGEEPKPDTADDNAVSQEPAADDQDQPAQPDSSPEAETAAAANGEGNTEDAGEVGAAAGEGEEEAAADAETEAAADAETEAAAGAETEAAGEEGAADGGEEVEDGTREAAGDGNADADATTEEGEGTGATEKEGAQAKEGGEAEEGAGDEEEKSGEAQAEGDGEPAPKEEGEEAGEKAEGETGDTAADDERPESATRVSEKLSREATPTAEEAAERHPDRIDEEDEEERLEATSPQQDAEQLGDGDVRLEEGDEIEMDDEEEEEEEDDYEEEEVEEEEYNREFMLESYKQAMADREQKQQLNSLLQTKLSDYFRRKKADQAAGAGEAAPQEAEKSITDQEQRYVKLLSQLEELRKSRDMRRLEYDERIEELDNECQIREEEVRADFEQLLSIKRKVGSKAVSAINGRPFPAVTQKRAPGPDGAPAPRGLDLLSTSVEDMMQAEADIEDQVIRVRLENIGLSNRVQKCELALKDKEELSEGLHMIDFEQLKIENQTYNEKIEERQEELLKLKKKITNNVQVLTHLKEKLQFVQSKKQEEQESLHELDEHLARRRDQLTRTKQARDSLRNDNQRLKQNSGLLGNEPLLRNFEENVDLVVEKKQRLEQLRVEQADLTLKSDKLKAKIREAQRLQGVQ